MGTIDRIWLIAACTIAVAGCATYEPKPIDPHTSAAEFSARRLDAPELRNDVVRLLPRAAAEWPPQPWDRAELLAVAMVRNGKLASAHAQIDAALAHEITAGQISNPDLTLQSEYARHDPHPWLYGFGLDFLLRSSDRKQADIELAQLETANARAQWLDQVWSVRHALIGALADREATRRRSDVLTRLSAVQDRLVAIEEKRVAAGEDAPNDLIAARQTRLEFAQQFAEVRSSAVAAQAATAAALGMPPSAIDSLDASWVDWGAPIVADDQMLQTAREQALLSRSDLAIAIGDYAQAENKLHQAVLRQYPQFHLSPGYYWDHGIAKFPFDVGFTLPLFNRSQGEIAEARAARDVAGQRMLSVQADILGQIESARIAERIARENLDIATRQLALAEQQQKNTQLGVRLGAVEIDEQVRADVFVLRGELEIIQLQAQLQTARNTLEDALRAPLSGPELELAPASANPSEASR